MPQTFRYPNLITLAGVDLTDESRGPLSEDRDERSNYVDLASGRKKKFVKSVRRSWSVSWENVGMSADDTVDGKGARNELREIAESAGTMTFTIQDGRNDPETYTVFIEDFSSELIMRHGGEDGFRFNMSLSLIEQG
jgi:hypothetical protein